MHQIERLNAIALRALKLDPECHRFGAAGRRDGAFDDPVSVMRQIYLDDREPFGEDRIGETDRSVFVSPQPAHRHEVFRFHGGEESRDRDIGRFGFWRRCWAVRPAAQAAQRHEHGQASHHGHHLEIDEVIRR